MPRLITDNSSDLVKSVALPNAANTVNTNAIDLGATVPFPLNESIGVKVSTGLATGANSKNINVFLQHSAEAAANFTNIPTLGVVAIAGNASNFPASVTNFSLPPGVKRYIRASALGEANGGNAADANLTLSLVF